MKKILLLSLTLIMLLSLVACGEKVDVDDETTETLESELPSEEPTSNEDLLIGEQSATLDCFGTDIMTNVSLTVPDTGWVYENPLSDRVSVANVPTLDDVYSNSPIIIVETKDSLDKINFYFDDFENLQELDNRIIGDVDMKGRTYKNVGMDWTEYYGELSNGVWLRIKVSGIDLSEGSEGNAILDSISFN